MTHKISNYLACFYADFCLLKYDTASNGMVFENIFERKRKIKIESAERKSFIVRNEGKK